MARRGPLIAAIVVLSAGSAAAVDHPVIGTKLIVIDTMGVSGRAKAVFVARDESVSKGSGTDPAAIEATLDVDTGAAHGTFVAPTGPAWLLNTAGVARYVNSAAPSGGAVKMSVVKPGKLIKLVAKSLGDSPLDLSVTPAATVYAAYVVTNDAETHRHCTGFSGCVYAPIAAGAGRKLLCKKSSAGDPTCQAALPPSTTSTTVTSTTTTSVPTTTLEVAYSVDCCQYGAVQCVNGYGFSLNYYLMQYCSSVLPGSYGVPGGVCSASGLCEVQTIDPPRALCCQTYGPSCYDDAVPASNTANVWTFRNYCVGANMGTAYYDAVCGPSGACLPQ